MRQLEQKFEWMVVIIKLRGVNYRFPGHASDFCQNCLAWRSFVTERKNSSEIQVKLDECGKLVGQLELTGDLKLKTWFLKLILFTRLGSISDINFTYLQNVFCSFSTFIFIILQPESTVMQDQILLKPPYCTADRSLFYCTAGRSLFIKHCATQITLLCE